MRARTRALRRAETTIAPAKVVQETVAGAIALRLRRVRGYTHAWARAPMPRVGKCVIRSTYYRLLKQLEEPIDLAARLIIQHIANRRADDGVAEDALLHEQVLLDREKCVERV